MSWPAWAAQNAQKRQVAGQWLEQQPFPRVFLLRRYINPICRVMEAYVEKSGDSWQARQLVADIKYMRHLSEDKPPVSPFVARGPFSKRCRRW